VSANFFDVLGVRPALGRTFVPEEDRTPRAAPVAVISHGLWQRRFGGNPGVVNRRVDINGHPFTIVGVTPQGFQGSMTALAYDLWVPMMMQPVVMPGADRLPQRDNHWLSAFGRLAPNATATQARDEIDAITRQIAADRPAYKDVGVNIALLRDSSDGAISVLRPVLLALAMVCGAGAADRLRQPGEPAARARGVAAPRDRNPVVDGREPFSHRAAAAHRERVGPGRELPAWPSPPSP
jgi:hypothetical protein